MEHPDWILTLYKYRIHVNVLVSDDKIIIVYTYNSAICYLYLLMDIMVYWLLAHTIHYSLSWLIARILAHHQK